MFGILRTLLAINVILLHIFNIPTLGNFSVTFFFMLSGFLMTLVVNEKYGYSIRGFKIFWINRFLRLYPIYWVVLLLTIIILYIHPCIPKHPHMYFPAYFSEWVENITMIYPNIVPHRIKPRLISPSWAISNELFYYLLISLGISKNKNITFLWFMLSVGYYIFTYLFYDLATFRYSAIPAASLAFSLGGLMYWYKDKLEFFSKSRVEFVIICSVLFYLNGIYHREIESLLCRDIPTYINLILAFFIIITLYKISFSKPIKNMDTYIGLYSYPFYISHYVVLAIFSLLTNNYGHISNSFKLSLDALPYYLIFIFIFTFTIIHLVDYPVENFRRKILKKL